MKRFFKWLFRRKSKDVPPQVTKVGPKPGPDIVGRQGGQARNRVHVYREPYGYPIRLCDWVAVDYDQIEDRHTCFGIHGPVDDMRVLAAALDYYEVNRKARVCQNCRAVAQGKRTSIGGVYHGHGKPSSVI